ncbi:D-sedoheptulose 7-phosphate isomerase [Buchnera aphidicola (Neophyllaphis podocarpi)]|uniref:D-sedoheptulose 7-phosphate isomerase n=1 Tax=Buchnera aphidicola TaxID=9 RepID=UPI0031B87493
MYYDKVITYELNNSLNVLSDFLKNKKQIENIEKAAILIANTFKKGGKVISCGNGGSHCDAMHFAEELTGKYRKYRKGYPAISISDSGYICCVGNDFGYEYIFSRYIESLGYAKDILLCLSTSGNSNNIINAINTAKKKQIKVISLIGNDGGKIKGNSDIEICIPYFGYADRIQEMHIKIIHIIIFIIEKEMKK